MVKIIPVICTRTNKIPKGYPKLINYFKDGCFTMEDQTSIFDGYTKGATNAIDTYRMNPEDILVFCHDDIEILNTYEHFKFVLEYSLKMFKDVGFVGVAGTKKLGEDCVWWNQQYWAQGYHRGLVYHGSDIFDSKLTLYTPPQKDQDREVIVLDGVFLACKVEDYLKIGFTKPSEFEGNWDFYDLWTTWKARRLGYKNYVVPITILHNSAGELVGREGWEVNRKAFKSLISTPIEIL